MMHASGGMLNHFATRKDLRWIRPVGVALLVGLAACAGTLFPLLTNSQSSVVFACGIGNTPTMQADGRPALLHPVTTNVSANQPIGIFALAYAVGQTISFNEDLSNVIAAPPQLQLLWTFGDGTQSNDLSPTHTYTKPGTYNVFASIYSDGWQPFDSAQIHVVSNTLPNPPVVKATASASVIGPDGVITFDATGSHSQDGSKLTYLWNFNDGYTATGPIVKHEFPALTGKWIVGLIVTDGRGALTFTAIHIQIVSQLPSAAITPSLTTIGAGGTVTFDASGSTPPSFPSGDQLVHYSWNFGDGTPQVTTSTPTITHKFNHAGTFKVTVQAIDQQGAPGAKSITITVVAITGNAAAPPWLLYGVLGLLIALVAGGSYLWYTNQRRRLALIREQEAAIERERARRLRSGQVPQATRYSSRPVVPGGPHSTRPPGQGQRSSEGTYSPGRYDDIPPQQRPRYRAPSDE